MEKSTTNDVVGRKNAIVSERLIAIDRSQLRASTTIDSFLTAGSRSGTAAGNQISILRTKEEHRVEGRVR